MRNLVSFDVRAAFVFLSLLTFIPALGAQQWYLSNPAGMALERSSSSTVALHSPWALSIERVGRAALPPILRQFDKTGYTLEQRLLYERGALRRRQWIFRDGGGVTRVNASLPADLETVGKVEGGEVPPFVEVFSASRSLIETHQFLTQGTYITKYSYREGILVKADSFLGKEKLWSDSYRYTRNYLLRRVERIYYKAGTELEAAQGRPKLPPTVPETPSNLDVRDAPPVPGFVNPGSPYDNSIMTDVLPSIYNVPAARIVYDTDSQGRILSETRYDEKDEVLAQINNEWGGERINVIRWTAGADQGRIVFRYSGKDRISEEDYRNGALERKVTAAGNRETEEIYVGGKAILRAVWESGRKISEEQLR
jgi:hypothetical protein